MEEHNAQNNQNQSTNMANAMSGMIHVSTETLNKWLENDAKTGKYENTKIEIFDESANINNVKTYLTKYKIMLCLMGKPSKDGKFVSALQKAMSDYSNKFGHNLSICVDLSAAMDNADDLQYTFMKINEKNIKKYNSALSIDAGDVYLAVYTVLNFALITAPQLIQRSEPDSYVDVTEEMLKTHICFKSIAGFTDQVVGTTGNIFSNLWNGIKGLFGKSEQLP